MHNFMNKLQASSPVTESLLKVNEPPAFECIRFGDKPIIISCDHASNRIPSALDNLGLHEEELQRHIAWDIGAAGVAKSLAASLGATLVSNNYSRLVVDCNRYLSDPSAFTILSDTTEVIGNQNLTEFDKAQRAESIYYAYHRTIHKELDRHIIDNQCPVLISIHSFTPELKSNPIERPWEIGVLWDKDPRIPLALLDALRKESNLVVGDNQPYSGRDLADYTVDHHAEKHGFAHTSIEIRQDLLQDEKGIAEWSKRLGNIFIAMLAKPEFFQSLKNNNIGN